MDINTVAFLAVFLLVIAAFAAIAMVVLDAQSKSEDMDVFAFKKFSRVSHGKSTTTTNYYVDASLKGQNTTILVGKATFDMIVPGRNYTLNCYTAFGGWYCK